MNNIYQTCSSAERRSERRLASRIQKGGEVTRQRSPALVPAPLFILEGVFYSHPPSIEVRWSWDRRAPSSYRGLSSSWTPSLRIHCRPGWRHQPSLCKEAEGRTWQTKRVVAPSAPFVVSRPTIDYPKSVFSCPRTSGIPTQHRSWRFTYGSTLQSGRRKDPEAKTTRRALPR